MQTEEWRDVITHVGLYKVSNFGRVKKLKHTRIMRNQVTSWEKEFEEQILKPSPNTGGYLQLTLSNPRRVARVHRLVAESFLQKPSEIILEECRKVGYNVAFVNHKDENKLNNNITNLEWCTSSYNSIGTKNVSYETRKGSQAYQSILDEDKVRDIFEMLKHKVYSQDEIASMYGVKQITISNIKTGRSWNQITGLPIKKRSVKSKAKSLELCESIIIK